MPSPIGHALGGALFGGLFADGSARDTGSRPAPRRWWRDALVLAAVGLLPDLDFVLGAHSRYTHSLGATLAAGVVAWLIVRSAAGAARGDGARASDRAVVWGGAPRTLSWAFAVAAAYGSHVLLDWLGHDTTPPIGIMALWPFSEGFFQSDLHLFMAISRRYWLANFWSHNLAAVAWELALLGPPTLAVWWYRSRVGAQSK